MEGASTQHKEEDEGHAPRLLDAPVKIQDQEGNDREGLDFMWGTDKVSYPRHKKFGRWREKIVAARATRSPVRCGCVESERLSFGVLMFDKRSQTERPRFDVRYRFCRVGKQTEFIWPLSPFLSRLFFRSNKCHAVIILLSIVNCFIRMQWEKLRNNSVAFPRCNIIT